MKKILLALTLLFASLTASAQLPNALTLAAGLGLNQTMGAPATLHVPIGGYFILCPTSGTFTINAAADQSAG